MLLEFCDEKHLCIANTCSRFADKKKITYGSGCNESEIDICIIGKVDRWFLKNVKVISRELQHSLMVADVDKKQIKETDWKPEDEKRNVTKLRDELCRQLFKCRVKEIMSDSNHDLWRSFEKVC